MTIGMNASRREKFRYLKEKGFKVHATMKTKELDKLLQLGDPPAEQPSLRGKRDGKRVPLGRHRSKLDITGLNVPKGKVPRWVNDQGGRINDALLGGYEFVADPNAEVGEDTIKETQMGSAVKRQVGTKEDGTPLTAYLMVIDKDLYEEDQADKAAEIDKIDSAIQHGRLKSDYEDGKYVPPGGIHYNPKDR